MVDVSPLLWQCILRGIVLPFRSPRVAKLYQSVWMEEGSPLLVYSRRQQAALAAQMPGTPALDVPNCASSICSSESMKHGMLSGHIRSLFR